MALFKHSVLNKYVLATLLLLATASLVHLDEDVQATNNSTLQSYAVAVSTASGYATESLLPVKRLLSLELGQNSRQSDCSANCPGSDAEDRTTPSSALQVLDPATIEELVGHWTIRDYQQLAGQKSALSAEEAYMVYSYLGQCQRVIRSEVVHDNETRRLQDMIDKARSSQSRNLIRQRLHELNQQYNQCSGLGTDLIVERIEWFTLSADLGYRHAQRMYYQTIPELISQQHMVAFRHPEILTRYRQKAPEYLETGLSADNPESYLVYSRAILDGIVISPDAVDAYAYAYVAMMLDESRSGNLRQELEAIESVLDRTELLKARKRGKSLLDKASIS